MLRLNYWWIQISPERRSSKKNNDRIAVNLRHVLASFWIDVSGQEVKATRQFAVLRTASPE